MKILVVIPTYDESSNIETLVKADLDIAPDIEVLVVDDNSPDGTGALVDELIASGKFGSRLHIMHRPDKMGLGTAYVQGFKWGLDRGFDIFISQDADFSHNPQYIRDMLSYAENGVDVLIGSRYVKGGKVVNWGVGRRIISRCGSTYARIILMMRIRDMTGGYNLYTRRALEAISLDTVMSKGYAFQIEMKWRCVIAELRVVETPIIFKDWRVGFSKMNRHIFIEAMWRVFYMAVHRRKVMKILRDSA